MLTGRVCEVQKAYLDMPRHQKVRETESLDARSAVLRAAVIDIGGPSYYPGTARLVDVGASLGFIESFPCVWCCQGQSLRTGV